MTLSFSVSYRANMKSRNPYPLTTQCACMDNVGGVWMTSNLVNGLFHLNIDTGKIEYVTSFDGDPMFCESLYTKAVLYEGKMICIPCVAKNIAIYELKTGIVRYVPIREEEYLVYFNVIQVDEKKLLLFPIIYSQFAYMFYMDTEVFDKIELDLNGEYGKAEGKIVQGEALIDGKAYFVIRETKMFFSWDIEKHHIQFYTGKNLQTFFTAASDNKHLYLFHTSGRSYDVYRETTYIDTRYLVAENKMDNQAVPYEEMKYNMSFCLDNLVINMPMNHGSVKVFSNEKFEEICLDWEKINMITPAIQAFSICMKTKNKLIFLPYHSNTIVKIDLLSKTVQYMHITIEKPVLNILYKKMWREDNGCLMAFEPTWTLQNYLEALNTKELDDQMADKNELEKTIGNKIYHALLKKEK